MIKIKLMENKNFKFNNKERYIHIEEYCYSDLPDISNSDLLDNLDLLYEGDGYKGSEDDVFVEILSCFNSICELGKNIYDTHILKNIRDINFEKAKTSAKYIPIYTLLYEWIKINGNPYKYIEPKYTDLYDILPEDRLMQFVYDSLICYAVYQIHTSILWLDNYDGEDDYNDTNDFEDTITNSVASNIKELIEFINLSELSKNTMDELYNTQSKVLEDAYEDGIIDKDLEILEEENIGSSEYQISINRLLISVISYIIADRNYDFLITSQRPIYIKDIEMFSLFENAESLIGVAYYQLLLNLTAGDLPYNIRRCKNPNCSIMFHSRYRQQYCNKPECQKYRKNIKGYNYYHRQEKKGKRKKASK